MPILALLSSKYSTADAYVQNAKVFQKFSKARLKTSTRFGLLTRYMQKTAGAYASGLGLLLPIIDGRTCLSRGIRNPLISHLSILGKLIKVQVTIDIGRHGIYSAHML
jgi:hypothetical protein